MMQTSHWTDERVETLKHLWDSGLSAAQIAKELACGLTRNAVIGKVTRLGLSGSPKRPSTGRPVRVRKPIFRRVSRVQTALAQVAEKETIEADVECSIIPLHQRRTLLELTELTCKWPVGHPGDTDFHFCGGPSLVGFPYCAAHSRKAYRGSSEL